MELVHVCVSLTIRGFARFKNTLNHTADSVWYFYLSRTAWFCLVHVPLCDPVIDSYFISLSLLHNMLVHMHIIIVFFVLIKAPDADCSSANVMPRQVTLVWTLDQSLQNAAITGYNLNCSSISSIINTTTTTGQHHCWLSVPLLTYTCTLTAQTTLRVIPLTNCTF